MTEVYTCPKCGATEDLWDEWSWRHHDSCPYVSCDSVECRALKTPSTLDEWKAAAEHWQKHSYLHGCSHGGV